MNQAWKTGGIAVAIICLVGCNDPESDFAHNRDESRAEHQVSAAEIYESVTSHYRQASTYTDKAVLYLTYRLDGKAIREPHPWSLSWNRNRQFSADLFNARIRNDGNNLSCYIFDIETGNLDNQHLLVPNQNFDYLLDDSIACHFLFGTSELPLDEIETESKNKLIPPLLGFVQPELLPDWLSSPDKMELVPDDNSTEKECHVLKLVHNDRLYFLWVSKHANLIEQIHFP